MARMALWWAVLYWAAVSAAAQDACSLGFVSGQQSPSRVCAEAAAQRHESQATAVDAKVELENRTATGDRLHLISAPAGPFPQQGSANAQAADPWVALLQVQLERRAMIVETHVGLSAEQHRVVSQMDAAWISQQLEDVREQTLSMLWAASSESARDRNLATFNPQLAVLRRTSQRIAERLDACLTEQQRRALEQAEANHRRWVQQACARCLVARLEDFMVIDGEQRNVLLRELQELPFDDFEYWSLLENDPLPLSRDAQDVLRRHVSEARLSRLQIAERTAQEAARNQLRGLNRLRKLVGNR